MRLTWRTVSVMWCHCGDLETYRWTCDLAFITCVVTLQILFWWRVCMRSVCAIVCMAAVVCTSKVRGEVAITACWVMTSLSLDRLDCCFILWCCCVDRKFSQRCLWEECGQEVRSVELVIRRHQHSHLSPDVCDQRRCWYHLVVVNVWQTAISNVGSSLWTLSEAVQCKVVTEVWSHDIKNDWWHGRLATLPTLDGHRWQSSLSYSWYRRQHLHHHTSCGFRPHLPVLGSHTRR